MVVGDIKRIAFFGNQREINTIGITNGYNKITPFENYHNTEVVLFEQGQCKFSILDIIDDFNRVVNAVIF